MTMSLILFLVFLSIARLSYGMRTTAFRKSSPQLLEFIEPTTNVKVVLVGAMHYNPQSIDLATNTVNGLGKLGELGAVLVESCPIRWNRTQTVQGEKAFFRKFLNNEMQAASDAAKAFNVPVILGDQLINVTNSKIGETFKQTVIDIATPFNGGWNKFLSELKTAAEDSLPNGPQYLGLPDFLDSKLLLATPVSIIRYPLAFILKAPKFGIPVVLGLTYASMNSGDYSFASNTMVDRAVELIESFAISGLEILLLSRIFLVAILAERNKVLAENILIECRRLVNAEEVDRIIYYANPADTPSVISSRDLPSRKQSLPFKKDDNIFAKLSQKKRSDVKVAGTSAAGQQAVVAVLGMAHCNGIMKLLQEKRIEV